MSDATVTISTQEYLDLVERANVVKVLIDTVREFDCMRNEMYNLQERLNKLEYKVGTTL